MPRGPNQDCGLIVKTRSILCLMAQSNTDKSQLQSFHRLSHELDQATRKTKLYQVKLKSSAKKMTLLSTTYSWIKVRTILSITFGLYVVYKI